MFRITQILLLLLLAYQLVAKETASSSALPRQESCTNSRVRRSLFNILWACFTTTIIHAWVAVPFDIPARERPLKGALRRLGLIFWTIFLAEFVCLRAVKELLAAITVRDVYNKRGASEGPQGIRNTVKTWVEGIQQTVKKLIAGIKKASNGEISWDEILDDKDKGWTLRHAYFLIMGGFLLIEPDEESVMRSSESEGFTTNGGALLTLARLRELVKDPEFEIEVTEDEIADRSKGASFAKFIAILQTSWFVVQVAARVLNGLDLTLIELSTLALACSNGIAILLWWHKPLGAQKPVRVLLKRRLTPAEREHFEIDVEVGFTEVLTLITWFVFGHGLVGDIGDTWLFRLRFFIFSFLLLPSVIVIHASVRTIAYLPARPWQPLFVAVSAIIGAVHCAAWNFPFYTYTEQTLWRVASLAVTSTACITAIGISSLSPTRVVVLAIITPVYATAKFVLLGLAVAQLRSLPPSSFVAIDWIQYYPHV